MLIAQKKGASSWLFVLPIKFIGYSLNKEECVDALHLRQVWKEERSPNNCAYGINNSNSHALSCNLGGFTSLRHNSIRNVEAKIIMIVTGILRTFLCTGTIFPIFYSLSNIPVVVDRLARKDNCLLLHISITL